MAENERGRQREGNAQNSPETTAKLPKERKGENGWHENNDVKP